MISFKHGDVVLVKFIFSERTGFKRRPALVISSNVYHQNRQEVVIAAITSNVERMLTGDTKIKEWKKANLLFPSLVTSIIQTVKHEMIERILGQLSSEDLKTVQENLKLSLGF